MYVLVYFITDNIAVNITQVKIQITEIWI